MIAFFSNQLDKLTEKVTFSGILFSGLKEENYWGITVKERRQSAGFGFKQSPFASLSLILRVLLYLISRIYKSLNRILPSPPL
jgi:hypothetical protein